MLPKARRLTRAKDFARLGTQGRSVFGPFLTMRVRNVEEKGPKVAFITSTKVFKRAVDRNRVKRRLRALVRDVFSEVPANVHILFIVKPEALKATKDLLLGEIRRLIAKIPDALLKPPKLSPGAVKHAIKRKAKDQKKTA